MKQPDVAVPMSSAPRDDRTIEVRTIEDGAGTTRHGALPGSPTMTRAREVRTGHWETDDEGGFIVDAEADAWRPRRAHAIAVHYPS